MITLEYLENIMLSHIDLLSNIDLSWINDIEGYENTTEEAGAHYMKGNNDNELLRYKNKAGNEFRKLKQKVTNNRLKQDLIKDLERYLFGEDIENIEPKEKYEKV